VVLLVASSVPSPAFFENVFGFENGVHIDFEVLGLGPSAR
jgi:hypothetical protein